MLRATIDRRHFLGSAAATAAFLATHDLAAMSSQTTATQEPKRPRLLAMELLSGAPLSAMKTFYGKTLDLRILKERSDRFTVEAGETQLTIVEGPTSEPGQNPFYHFAFNIPENKIRQALDWQKTRSPILTIPEQHRASGYPPEVMEHRQWNAHSIFFTDPAGNVVEYIARHGLGNGDTVPFSWADLLYVSEVGLVVDDLAASAEKLAAATSLSPYTGGATDTAAIGDEYGLILLMKRGRPLDIAPPTQRHADVYRTGITLRAAKAGRHDVPNYPYQVVLEERCSCA